MDERSLKMGNKRNINHEEISCARCILLENGASWKMENIDTHAKAEVN